MEKTKSLSIHTVTVKGDYENFRIAFTRSVLGVTFKKFKRKGKNFYQHRIHNEKLTSNVCSFIHQSLVKNIQNISDYETKTDLMLHWDETGKITEITNIAVAVFLKMGNLVIPEIQPQKKLEMITIDLFYSDVDAASQKIKKVISEIMAAIGEENFEYHQWNLLNTDGKEMANRYGVQFAPTIIINANPKLMFENPDEKQLRTEIEELYIPEICEPVVKFEKSEKAKEALQIFVK